MDRLDDNLCCLDCNNISYHTHNEDSYPIMSCDVERDVECDKSNHDCVTYTVVSKDNVSYTTVTPIKNNYKDEGKEECKDKEKECKGECKGDGKCNSVNCNVIYCDRINSDIYNDINSSNDFGGNGKIKKFAPELNKLTPQLKEYLSCIMTLNILYKYKLSNIIEELDSIVKGDKVASEIEESIVSLLNDLKQMNIN